MDYNVEDSWLKRWEENNIGFHRDYFDPDLLRFADKLGELESKTVFVPLCGKTLDMVWFIHQGADVVGVELSSIAVEDFFAENDIEYVMEHMGDINKYEADNITIYCCDLFKLTPEIIGHIDLIYDRASLIAMQPQVRERYVAKLHELLSIGGEIFLIALEHNLTESQKPPFNLNDKMVHELFHRNFQINLLGSVETENVPAHLQQRGMEKLFNHSYLLKKNSE